ncbi:MAG TPA: cytidylate kinase family protein [Thermohalobaculum sp.]|nr:cytidylate kinase family protein [Thermohalobaculum sp.]
MTVIAMTREMGSLGKEVARLAADRLGLTIVNHEMIGSADERANATTSAVARFLETGPGPEDKRNGGISHGGYLTPSEILELASRGQVLIRGWGAARLLREVPHILTVRVCAPLERRVEEMCRRLGVDAATAKREIERSDAEHAQAFLRFFSTDWRRPTNYDMVLNTNHLSVESCADILVDAARSVTLAETPESRRVLEDKLLEARIDERLHGATPFGRRASYVQSSVEGGRVRLYGAVSDTSTAREIEAMVRELPGVAALESQIARVPIYGN